MPDVIQLLPEHIANQIAAGEVIQRPASAVKELLENSVDAGATAITLVLRDAGKSLIQVIDNGCGMSETDARMCFERHATSKIRTIDDLFAIRTMGFRGEAMASIAAVAQVEMKTRRRADELGTHVIIEGSAIKKHEPCQCAEGTSISVRNLFFNVPARRNFLKSNHVETSHIVEEFKRVALAHPHIAFFMTHNDTELFHLRPGNLRQRLVAVLGSQYNDRLIPVKEETDIVNIYGFVGKPEHARKTRGEQYLFVNRRYVRNHYIAHAIASNYDGLISPGGYPLYVLFLEINPARIDINVHPTKQEIKFDEESVVYTIVRTSVKHALAKYSLTPQLDFDQEIRFDTLTQQIHSYPPLSTDKPPVAAITPRSEMPARSTDIVSHTEQKQWKQLYDIVKQTAAGQVAPNNEKIETLDTDGQQAKTPYQLHRRYVLSPIKSGFLLIDQQAAHERILYEEMLLALRNRKAGTPQQLFPSIIQLSADDAALLREVLPEVQALGFVIEEFGNNTFALQGIPPDLPQGNYEEIIEKILEEYKNNLAVWRLDKREGLARAMAQQASIKSGQPLSDEQMQYLIDRLFACEQPYVTPDGRLTFITINLRELEKRFSQSG